jgi:hypothetical protein
MQKGYHQVSGWLGIIIGDKIFVDYTKYEFDDAMNRLIKQIKLNTKEKVEDLKEQIEEININSINLNDVKTSKSIPNTDANKAINWSDKEVEDWFIQNEIHELYEDLKPLHGKLLHQLYQLQVYTPEFFFKSITKNDKTNLKTVVNFGYLLKEIFKD